MRSKVTLRKRYILSAIILLVVVLVIVFIFPLYSFISKKANISLTKTLFNIDTPLTIDNKVNFVLLGIAGGTHDGPTLSDSITFMSYNYNTNILSSIGIPRDVWSETLRDKINSAYAYGEAKMKGGGMKLAKAEVGSIVGVPIQYAVVINFQEFKELIDMFGGVDVVVQHAFTDKKYPIDGKENDPCGGDHEYKCRYETITFSVGKTHMDGTTALKFVRSRNAEGDEGSDFARNQRQQLVMTAIKGKIIGVLLSFNSSKINTLYDNLNKLVVRDITNQQLSAIAKNIIIKRGFKQQSTALPRELFSVPDYGNYDGKYVLIPETGSFDQIHSFVANYISLNK